ncbi:hypothetical protein ACFC01_32925, partial [Streptomyces mirabilis]
MPDLRTAAALIGASIERCAPCRQSLTAKLLEEDPIVLAVTAGAAYRLHAAARVPEEEGPVAEPAQAFSFLVEHARAHGGDARLLLAVVERMPAADRAALLGDALDLFRYRGRKIEHPAEASFIDSHLARAAGEMTTALTLLRTFVGGLRAPGRRAGPLPLPGEEDRTSCGGLLHRQSSRPR